MIWKLLGLQKKLDALFDDGWMSIGAPPSGRIHAHASRPNSTRL